MTILEVFSLVRQSLNHILSNNIAFVFLKDWKLKINLRNSIFGPFGGQNVSPGWVNNDKKGYFCASHLTLNPVFTKTEVLSPGWVNNDKKGYFCTSHLTLNPVFTKTEVLKSNSLLTHKENLKIN